jgi:gliding motility-associated-like protein
MKRFGARVFSPVIPRKPLLFLGKICLLLHLMLGTIQTNAQECPILISPLNSSTDISVNTAITWNDIQGVTGYFVSIGTTPGGIDIINRRSVGSAASFRPPLGLPENEELFITITLFFLGNIPEIECDIGSFTTEDVTEAPNCNTITSPANGTSNVSVATNINWNYAPLATGYRISIGTTAGGTDITNNLDVNNSLSYNHPTDFLPSQTIYVTVTPYNENGNASGTCTEISFTTGELATIPDCTYLITPFNGETNVPLTPRLEWAAIAGATGYRVTIGTSPTNGNILNNSVFSDNSTYVVNFEPNRTFFIRIVPFNSAGEAIGCPQETFSTILGCGPFYDENTGELTYLNPVINFPDEVNICLDQNSTLIASDDLADGYRWYQITDNDREVLLSSESTVNISEIGDYVYEAYNILTQAGNQIECPTRKEFKISASERPIIDNINITENSNNLRIETLVSSDGNYEYSLNKVQGPYQDSNVFLNIPFGTHTVYVRDKAGCGSAKETIIRDLTVTGFPTFFTPNGDGTNDFWQFKKSPDSNEINIETIRIYDRYGNLMIQLDPKSVGWNGYFNGNPMPASDYWYRAITFNQKEISGHFTLKR